MKNTWFWNKNYEKNQVSNYKIVLNGKKIIFSANMTIIIYIDWKYVILQQKLWKNSDVLTYQGSTGFD